MIVILPDAVTNAERACDVFSGVSCGAGYFSPQRFFGG
jgi:hypothetical protein